MDLIERDRQVEERNEKEEIEEEDEHIQLTETPIPEMKDRETIRKEVLSEASPKLNFNYSEMVRDRRFYYFLIAVFLIAGIGGYMISETMKTEFYETLTKPIWAPPPTAISVIWGILYFLIAYSTYRAYLAGNEESRKMLLYIFAIQLFINLVWVYVFFYLKNPKAARLIILLLLAMILIQGTYMYSLDPMATYAFIPYFLWVAFASYLNFEIVKLNSL